jgi:FkbM family methyltransferase
VQVTVILSPVPSRERPLLDPNRINSQTLAGKLLRLPLGLVPNGLDVPVVSGPNKGMRWRTGSSVHGCWLGTYESDKVELLRRHVKPGMVAYDIGANAGYYTLLLSRLVGPLGRVYAFEPLPENLVNLTHHVRINDLRNCEVVAAALSDKSGLAGFRTGASNSMGSLVDGEATLRVPTVTLDELVDQAGFAPPDFLKMDIEGAEALALSGARGVLGSRASTWFIALHGTVPAKASASVLLRSGFDVFDLGGKAVDEDTAATLSEIYAVKAGHR